MVGLSISIDMETLRRINEYCDMNDGIKVSQAAVILIRKGFAYDKQINAQLKNG